MLREKGRVGGSEEEGRKFDVAEPAVRLLLLLRSHRLMSSNHVETSMALVDGMDQSERGRVSKP